MKAVVLAAGKGVRMLPLTLDRPKVMIDVNNKPFLWYVIENLKKAGISDIGVVIGHRFDQVKSYFGDELTYIEQTEQLGTGHAVMQAEEFVGHENFILVMGDNLYSSRDTRELASKKDRFCYVSGFISNNPKAYGVLETDKDLLVKIDEKPQWPKGNLVNTGIYKLTPDIFNELKSLKKSMRGEYELTDAINNLAKLLKVKVYRLVDYWIDMSYKEQLPEISKKLKEIGF